MFIVVGGVNERGNMIKDWDKIAQREFEAMPRDYRADWAELRQQIMKS